jgi:two-component sensor histidine kinase
MAVKAFAGGALLLLVAGLFAYRAYRLKKRSSEQLAAKNAIIDAQLKEKELLVREIHHRVKNNLQTVSSLLSIQGRGIADEAAKEAVNDSRLRVKSMALIHQDLYREGDLTGVRMMEYVEKLAGSLITSYAASERVTASYAVDDIALDVDTAVPIGLVLNELLTNALKYAWPDGRTGRLMIALKHHADALELTVADDGVGKQDTTGDERSSGFGMNMVRTFANKLKAEHSVEHVNGTTVRMLIRNFKLAR